jgi:hypothetical protein
MEGRRKRGFRAWTYCLPLALLAGLGFAYRGELSQHPIAGRTYGSPRVLAVIRDPRVTESSGIAPSQISDNAFYTFNDSGDSARFFKFDRSGKVVAVFSVPNAANVDWEDMASATLRGKPYLFFGDIGDNGGVRKTITVYRVPEPRGTSARADEILTLKYPDEPRNAETLLVNPKSGDITIVTKASLHPAGIYFLKNPGRSGTFMLTKLADIDLNATMREAKLITGGAWSQDGAFVILRTYLGAYEFHASDMTKWYEAPPTRVHLDLEMQGEGITYSRDGRSLLTTTEGSPCPVSIVAIEYK